MTHIRWPQNAKRHSVRQLLSLAALCAFLLPMVGCAKQAAESPSPAPSQAAAPTQMPEPTPTPTSEPTPEPTPTKEPISPAELEFSIMIGDKTLTLGVQDGEFPWGTELELDSEEYWSSDGFHGFEFTCGENLTLGGLCLEAKGTEKNGSLTRIENRNPDYKTYRGAYIGMTLEDFLELYPDAEEVSSGCRYDYIDPPNCFLDQLVFYFEEDRLVEFKLGNGIDGWAY